MNDRVLVTGGSGLIGQQLVTTLQDAGFFVVALSRGVEVANADQTIVCDLLDGPSRRAALANANARNLIHLAWHDAPQGRWTAPENFDWAAATISLMREFAECGGQRMIAAGSCAEYDWSYEKLAEATPLRPSSVYGRTKAQTGSFLCETYADLGLSLAWARIHFVYGPGEPRGRLLGDLIYGLAAGQKVDCSDGLQERDYMHTADIAAALVAVLESTLEGPVNIATGNSTKVKDLIETAADLAGRPELINLGARPRPPDDPPRLVADVSKLHSIGFSPKYDLRSGLRDCLIAAQGIVVE